MVLTNKESEIVTSFLIGDNAVSPNYIFAGTGTTAETISDTSLVTSVKGYPTTNTSNNGTVDYTTDLPGFLDFLGLTVTEVGLFDTSSEDNLFIRSVINGITFESDKQYVVDLGVTNIYRLPLTNEGMNLITTWLVDNSGTAPSHISWGTYYILDKMDAVTGWTGSTDAIAVALNTNNQEGTYALSIGKDGTASTSFFYTKTITSIDISNSTQIRLWVNITDNDTLETLSTTTALQVRVGNDSSNYYIYNYDNQDLIVGWQRLDINITDMTQVGTVDLSTIDYLRINFFTNNLTDTVTLGNIILDYPHAYQATAVTDTDLINEIDRNEVLIQNKSGNNVAVLVANLGLSEGNTYNVTQSGLHNDASAGDLIMISEDIVTNKSVLVQIRQEFDIQFNINEDEL